MSHCGQLTARAYIRHVGLMGKSGHCYDIEVRFRNYLGRVTSDLRNLPYLCRCERNRACSSRLPEVKIPIKMDYTAYGTVDMGIASDC